MAVERSESYALHTFVVAPTQGSFERLLIAYVGGPAARAMQRSTEAGGTWQLAGDDDGHGKPRSYAELPGRCYEHLTHTANVAQLHGQLMKAPAQTAESESLCNQREQLNAQRPVAMAVSRVGLLAWLASFGYVPTPSQLQIPGGLSERNARSWLRARLPEPEKRDGAYESALLTWRVFASSSTYEQAIFILATLKGYYQNFYPAYNHCDKDLFLETWMLLNCLEPDGVPSGPADAPLPADIGGTHLPLLNLVLMLVPDADVAHAFFRDVFHAAHDAGQHHASLLRAGPGGRPAAFLLQSGGCSERKLHARFA